MSLFFPTRCSTRSKLSTPLHAPTMHGANLSTWSKTELWVKERDGYDHRVLSVELIVGSWYHEAGAHACYSRAHLLLHF